MPPQQYPPVSPSQYPGVTPPSPKLPKTRTFFLPFAIVLVGALVFIGLFVWAFLSRQDYKQNVSQKVNSAVKVAVQQESSLKDKEFLQKEKSPVKTFSGPDTFGGITFNYPKTWSAYVIESERSSIPVDGYFHPDIVPDISGKTAYALRIRVLNQTYDTILKSFESQIKQGKVTMSAYSPSKQKNVVGARLDGEINIAQKDHMAVLPLRDKTIELSTESDQFQADFDKIVLDSLNFTP